MRESDLLSLTVSVITPTYQRAKDLRAYLGSLLAQSLAPMEVTVVENGPGSESAVVVEELRPAFAAKAVALRHARSPRNSLPTARNMGARMSRGDILMFLDDDVLLERTYVEEIVRVYEDHPDAVGVQGYIEPDHRSRWKELLHTLFFWYHTESNACRVLSSVSSTYPSNLRQVITCEWMSGANHSYRREVFEDLAYDENLLKYADGEDLESSYRVHMMYPTRLFITPFARLEHLTSMDGRAVGRELVYMREVYGLYLFFKLFPANARNLSCYVWSRIGRLGFTAVRALRGSAPGARGELKHLIGAYRLCLRKVPELRRGELGFFNETLGL